MTKIAVIRFLVILAVIHGLFVQKMDVKRTFYNGEWEEEIYMSQPKGYVVTG